MNKSIIKEIDAHSRYLLEVSVKPNSKTQDIELDGDFLFISICSPPDKGKANKELVSALAKKIGVSSSCFSIISGHKSRDKIIEINVDSSKGFTTSKLIEMITRNEK